jgi:hypothetical protein
MSSITPVQVPITGRERQTNEIRCRHLRNSAAPSTPVISI